MDPSIDQIYLLPGGPLKKRKINKDDYQILYKAECSDQPQSEYEDNSLQESLKTKEFIRLTILKALRESPHQNNSKNIIKSLHNDLIEGFDGMSYDSEIRSMMYSVGEVKNPDRECIRSLEKFAIRYLSKLISKLVLIVQTRLKEEIGVKSLKSSHKSKKVTLDDLAKSLLPNCKSIRMLEYIAHSIKWSKRCKFIDKCDVSIISDLNNSQIKYAESNLIKDQQEWHPNQEIEDMISSTDPSWTFERVKEERGCNDVMTNMVKCFNQEEYLEWHSHVKISFLRPHKKEKFSLFLQNHCGLDEKVIKLDKLVKEALGFIVKDFIQNITIKALKMKVHPSEPIDPINLKNIIEKINETI